MKQRFIQFTVLAFVAIALLFAVLIPGTAYAGVTNVTFAWDEVTDPQVTEVRIFQRTLPDGVYDYTKPAGTVAQPANQLTVDAIPNGTYAWVGRGCDKDGNQSKDSNEVERTLDAPLGTIQNLRIPLTVP